MYVKFVTLFIPSADAPMVALISAILPVPKAIDLTLELFDWNVATVRVKLLRFNAPAVSVHTPVALVVTAPPKVTFEPASNVMFVRVLPAVIIVPVELKNN